MRTRLWGQAGASLVNLTWVTTAVGAVARTHYGRRR